MKKIGMGLVGPGFVAGHHIDAVRRLGDVDVVAIAGSSQQSAEKKAREYKVDRAFGAYKMLIADPDIQLIHSIGEIEVTPDRCSGAGDWELSR
jgi:predicted dehydrogenase